jgi:putative tricarboxylic transport membrane protein
MKKIGDILASFLFVFLGIGIMIGSLRLGVGRATAPQPGFIPFLSGMALAVLSAILLVQGWRGQSKGSQVLGDLKRPAILIAGLVFYVGILDVAGYIIATAVISAIVLWILETRSWWILLVVSLALGIGTYLLFDRLLGVTFPIGILKGFL